MTTVLVTGGAGFIGSALVRMLVRTTDLSVINVDSLTYAGNLESLPGIENGPKYVHYKVDICDARRIRDILSLHRPQSIIHLAAESHVDRSIDGSDNFVRTNVLGTYSLLQQCLRYWRELGSVDRDAFRFVHVSTDEVYGSLGSEGRFTEQTPYAPNSPYAATKAGSDHLVRAWGQTYGIPTVLTHCSNNYGPFQFPEKLIPLMIQKALQGKPLPVYGRGENIRDWIYVDDHCHALRLVLEHGEPGGTYNIGGSNERRNIDVVEMICRIVDEHWPDPAIRDRRSLIEFVDDRPGHDFRYAIDTRKIRNELGWKPAESFESGLQRTVSWYQSNQNWCSHVQRDFAGQRMGFGGKL